MFPVIYMSCRLKINFVILLIPVEKQNNKKIKNGSVRVSAPRDKRVHRTEHITEN